MKGIVLTLVAVTLLACSETENDVRPLISDLPIGMDLGIDLGRVSVLEVGEGRIYAGTYNGIFISQDAGYTWHISFKAGCNAAICDAITVDGNTVYAGIGGESAFRSDDAGVTWKPIRDGLPFIDLSDGRRFYREIKQILVTRDKIIAAVSDISGGVYISTDRGETWHNESAEWSKASTADTIRSMTEFDNYLWISTLWNKILRSPDHGETWKSAGYDIDERILDYSDQRVTDWAVLGNRLYIAIGNGVLRWNESTRTWEDPMNLLPRTSWATSLAVHDDLLFVGLEQDFLNLRGHLPRQDEDVIGEGVYVFDAQTETWSSTGLEGVSVDTLQSYKFSLYAGTEDGIYRAEVIRLPHGGVATTWEHMAQ